MDQEHRIPQLLSFYFGDSASHASHAASPRLRKWSKAFESWILDYTGNHSKDTLKHALLAWRRLVRQSGRLPWRLTPTDIDQHISWLRQEGFASSTINASLGFISSFYQWVDNHRSDPACPLGFDPTAGAACARQKYNLDQPIWSLAQVQAFLDLLRQDASPLGKRDYAFFLARLNLGVPLKYLQHLKWGQLEQRASATWVDWRSDGHWYKLPGLVWQAILDYLQASGRLSGISPLMFVFVPQVTPVLEGSGTHAMHWLADQPLSGSTLLRTLKLYARRLGISESRLTFTALRRTAIRLKLDQGESLENMQSFLATREKLKSTRFRLARLPKLSASDALDASPPGPQPSLPLRVSRPLTGEEGITHGFFTRQQDQHAVQKIIAEGIHGMQLEITCLRELMRGLLDLDDTHTSMVESYSQAARRLGILISSAASQAEGAGETRAGQLLRELDEAAIRLGMPLLSPAVQQADSTISPDQTYASAKLTEEIATLRLMLRNVYRHAQSRMGTREYSHLVDLYGLGCVRLARLLKLEGNQLSGQIEICLHSALDEAIRQLQQEWQLEREKRSG
jgi:hypothetical protein